MPCSPVRIIRPCSFLHPARLQQHAVLTGLGRHTFFCIRVQNARRLAGAPGRLKDAARLAEVEAPGAACLALHPFRPLLVRAACAAACRARARPRRTRAARPLLPPLCHGAGVLRPWETAAVPRASIPTACLPSRLPSRHGELSHPESGAGGGGCPSSPPPNHPKMTKHQKNSRGTTTAMRRPPTPSTWRPGGRRASSPSGS